MDDFPVLTDGKYFPNTYRAPSNVMTIVMGVSLGVFFFFF